MTELPGANKERIFSSDKTDLPAREVRARECTIYGDGKLHTVIQQSCQDGFVVRYNVLFFLDHSFLMLVFLDSINMQAQIVKLLQLSATDLLKII